MMSTPSFGHYLPAPEMSSYLDMSEPIRNVLRPCEYTLGQKTPEVGGCRRFSITTEAVVILQSTSARPLRQKKAPTKPSQRTACACRQCLDARISHKFLNNVTSGLPPRDAKL